MTNELKITEIADPEAEAEAKVDDRMILLGSSCMHSSASSVSSA